MTRVPNAEAADATSHPFAAFAPPRYRAPELLLGAKTYGAAVDAWALGCIVAELHRLSPLFLGAEAKVGELQADQLHKLFLTLGMPRDELWPQALPLWPTVQRWRSAEYPPDGDALPAALGASCEAAQLSLLRGLLRLNPASRCSAEDALTHRYFQSEDHAQQPPSGGDGSV